MHHFEIVRLYDVDPGTARRRTLLLRPERPYSCFTATGTGSATSGFDWFMYQDYFGWYCGVLGYCNQPAHGGGGPGGGSGKPSGVLQKVQKAYCEAVPEASTVGLTGSLGIVGGQAGTLELVTNYDTGEQSLFASGGPQFGFAGGASGGVMFGFIQGLAGSNANYQGPFSNASGSVGPFGLTLSATSQGLNGPLKLSLPTAATVSIGKSLLFPFSVTGSATNYSKPLGVGNLLTNPTPFAPKTLLDLLFYLARRPCS